MSIRPAPRRVAQSVVYVALLSLVLGLVPRTMRAQSGRRTTTSRVTTVMPAVAVVRSATAPRARAKGEGRMDLVADVTVAANTSYTVTVRSRRAIPAGVRISVRNAQGVYVPLSSSTPVRVARGGRGVTHSQLSYRVEGSVAALRSAALDFTYAASSENGSSETMRGTQYAAVSAGDR